MVGEEALTTYFDVLYWHSPSGILKTTKNPIHDKQPRLQPPEYKSYSFVHQIMAHTGNDYTTLHDF
jgi:hypothetical protein